MVKVFRPVTVKDADGNVIGYTEKTFATYTYDAWGKLIGIIDSAGNNLINKQTTSTALANLNPLRYRGYYYDNETGFYYLQSRYYDPANRRFINADSYASTGQGFIGTNMFAYCNNNPVIYADSTGHALDPRFGTTTICDGSTSRGMSVFEMLIRSMTFYGGVGMGLEAQATVFDIGISLGMHGDFGAVSIRDADVTTGQHLQVGATASIPGITVGYLDISERETGKELVDREVRGVDQTETSITFFSFSVYVIAGVTVDFGFDFGKFFGYLEKYT